MERYLYFDKVIRLSHTFTYYYRCREYLCILDRKGSVFVDYVESAPNIQKTKKV